MSSFAKKKSEKDLQRPILPLSLLWKHSQHYCRAERDFGLETETETWVVSVSVSILETTYSKSQYQSQFSRQKWRVSVSVSKFDTINQESRSQSQQISIGLAHPKYFLWFIYDLQPHDFLISFKYHTFDPIWALNFCHIKCWCAS